MTQQLGFLLLAACATFATACGPGARSGNGNGGVDSGGQGSGIDAPQTVSIDGPPGAGDSLVYAHSAGTLYIVNTTTFAETQIGNFTGISGDVTDIAVDKNGSMVAITDSTLYSVDVATAKGTQIKTLSADVEDFTGLGYVPNPTDSSSDLLVTANADGDVYTIDPTNGTGTKVGNYGKVGNKQIGSSGDIFGVRNFGIYATVKLDGGDNDYLAKIDPATWTASVPSSDTGFANIYGVGFWAGSIFGFDDAGDVLQLDPNTGKGTKMDNNQVVWWGAGVTTNAPIIQ